MNLTTNKEALAIVEAEVDRATAPYIGILSPAKLEIMRDFVRDNLLMNPAYSPMVEQLVAAPVVTASEEREVSTEQPKKEETRERGGKSG